MYVKFFHVLKERRVSGLITPVNFMTCIHRPVHILGHVHVQLKEQPLAGKHIDVALEENFALGDRFLLDVRSRAQLFTFQRPSILYLIEFIYWS